MVNYDLHNGRKVKNDRRNFQRGFDMWTKKPQNRVKNQFWQRWPKKWLEEIRSILTMLDNNKQQLQCNGVENFLMKISWKKSDLLPWLFATFVVNIRNIFWTKRQHLFQPKKRHSCNFGSSCKNSMLNCVPNRQHACLMKTKTIFKRDDNEKQFLFQEIAYIKLGLIHKKF